MWRRRNTKKHSLIREIFITSCTVVLLGTMLLGSAAYLQKISGINNEFGVAKTDIKVEESFDETKAQKSDVRLINTGNTPVYMRAKVLIYYIDDEGNVLGIVPKEGIDYIIESGSSDWIKKDDIFYYNSPVEPSSVHSTNCTTGETTNLINHIRDLIPEDDKYLVIDVLGQSIQANPATAVEEAWNITKEDIQ